MFVHGAAAFFEAFAQRLRERTPVEHAVQLVTTGPEGGAAVHSDTAVAVQDLFRGTQKSVLISTYAFYRGREIFDVRAARMDANAGLTVRTFANIERKPTRHAQPGAGQPFCRQVPRIRLASPIAFARALHDVRSTNEKRSDAAVLRAKCKVIDGEELFITSESAGHSGRDSREQSWRKGLKRRAP